MVVTSIGHKIEEGGEEKLSKVISSEPATGEVCMVIVWLKYKERTLLAVKVTFLHVSH